jgi:hypothetical protein
MPDLPDFVSPIDGTVVNGRAGLRAHNKRHNVTNPADYKNEWAKKTQERERMYTGDKKYDAERRKEAIIRSVNKHWR